MKTVQVKIVAGGIGTDPVIRYLSKWYHIEEKKGYAFVGEPFTRDMRRAKLPAIIAGLNSLKPKKEFSDWKKNKEGEDTTSGSTERYNYSLTIDADGIIFILRSLAGEEKDADMKGSALRMAAASDAGEDPVLKGLGLLYAFKRIDDEDGMAVYRGTFKSTGVKPGSVKFPFLTNTLNTKKEVVKKFGNFRYEDGCLVTGGSTKDNYYILQVYANSIKVSFADAKDAAPNG